MCHIENVLENSHGERFQEPGVLLLRDSQRLSLSQQPESVWFSVSASLFFFPQRLSMCRIRRRLSRAGVAQPSGRHSVRLLKKKQKQGFFWFLGAEPLVPGRLLVVVVGSVIKSVFFSPCLRRSGHAVSASLSA